MAVKIKLCLFTILLFSSAALAENKLPPVPDPMALDADWWSYFKPDEKIDSADLDARIEKTNARLKNSLTGVAAAQRTSLMPQVKRIQVNLNQYSNLRQLTVIEKPSLTPVAAQYTIDEALERFVAWRKQSRETDLEQSDLTWQKAQQTLERKRQLQRRNNYLALSTSDAQRLQRGVELMANRVSLELLVLQNKHREEKLKNARLQLQHMQNELELIPQHLVLSSSINQVWLEEQSKQRAKADALRQQAEVQLSDQSPSTPLGSANIKYLLLVNTGKEVQIATHELTAMRYAMAQALEESDAVQTQNNKRLTEISTQFVEIRQSIKEREEMWRSLTGQTKKFASGQEANYDRVDLELSEAYKRLLNQVDDIDRWMRKLELEQDVGGFLLKLADAKVQGSIGLFKRWQSNTETWLAGSGGKVSEWLNATLVEINEVPVTSLGLLRVLFIITIAWLISKLLRQGLGKLGKRKDGVSASALYTLGRVVHYIILVVGVIIGLSSIGIDFTKFALFASALGVGIGFGLQTLISNFVAGLIILFERSLKVGDFVELSSGLVGEVKEINMRSTLVTTNDNVDILVPNSEFVNSQVTNWTLRDTQRRIHIPFGVAYGTDKDLTKKAVLEAAYEVTWTLNDKKNRQPQVWFVQFGDSSLNFELVVWLKPEAVKRPSAVQAAYLWEIDTKLKKYGIEIPFPQRDLHVRSVFGQKDDAGWSLLDKYKTTTS